MKRFTTTFIAIRFNNTRTPYFKPTRGLRQCDPLSPLLFVICMEGFSVLINHAKQTGSWVPYSLKLCRNPPTHLAFVDDFILQKPFLKAFKELSKLSPSFAKTQDIMPIWKNKKSFLATHIQSLLSIYL